MKTIMSFRFDNSFIGVLRKTSCHLGVTMTQLIELGIYELLKDSEKLQDLKDRIIREGKYVDAVEDWKQTSKDFYIYTSAVRRILEIIAVDSFIGNPLDMQKINCIIDKVLTVCEHLRPEIKKLIIKDINNIKKFREPEYALNYFRNNKQRLEFKK